MDCVTSDEPLPGGSEVLPATLDEYRTALRTFDAAVCEAMAVSQAASGRQPEPHAAFATYVFSRLCSHSIAIIRSAPKTRWVSSDFDNWEFGAIAGHARTILEARLLFSYISKDPSCPDEWAAKLNVMNLHDCTRRIRLVRPTVDKAKNKQNEQIAEDLRERLRSNPWFRKLDPILQKTLLSGDRVTITTQKQQIAEVGWDPKEYFVYFDFWSQYAHSMPVSFYRMEPNGRGTGLDNDTDRSYYKFALEICSQILVDCTDRMVELFPDVAPVRQGSDSKFSPGPRRNLPKRYKRRG